MDNKCLGCGATLQTIDPKKIGYVKSDILYSEKEEVLIVEVPDTKKYDYNKFISIILIIVGSLFIIRSKKTTH